MPVANLLGRETSECDLCTAGQTNSCLLMDMYVACAKAAGDLSTPRAHDHCTNNTSEPAERHLISLVLNKYKLSICWCRLRRQPNTQPPCQTLAWPCLVTAQQLALPSQAQALRYPVTVKLHPHRITKTLDTETQDLYMSR